jgi:hypothetical protein
MVKDVRLPGVGQSGDAGGRVERNFAQGFAGQFPFLVEAVSDALLEAGLDEAVEVAVEHGLGVADFVVGAQILDA